MAEEPKPESDKPSNPTPNDAVSNHHQLPSSNGFEAPPNGDCQMFPIMYPILVPGVFPLQQGQEQMNSGAGIYAVPTLPFMGPVAGLPLVPLTYNIPTGSSSSEAGAVGTEQGQVGQLQQQPNVQQAGPQRQVVRRFQIEIHLDLLLILKLAAVIFLFNQDGSRQRLVLLVFFASIIYLYQTGALAPLVRWLSRGMQRAAAPPQPPRPVVGADNAPAAARHEHENAAVADGQARVGAENDNQPLNEGNQPENEQQPGAAVGGNRLWGIVKEIQMIVFGFITSLLPGFHMHHVE